jgi:DNA-binding NarL/FixJ family response regulator
VPIRVILADDSYLVREGIEEILAGSEGVVVEASCADKDSLLAEVDARNPDVVVTDIRMPPTSTDEGIEIAARLRETHPHIGVVILSQYSDPTYALRLLDPGSDGRAYLLKDRVHDRAELIDAIQAAAAGRSVIDPKVVEILVQAQTRAERSPLSELTPRELEVLSAIAQGKSNSAIAEDMVLTKRAVEKHINAIFLKLGLTYASESEEISKRVKAALLFLAESPNLDAR